MINYQKDLDDEAAGYEGLKGVRGLPAYSIAEVRKAYYEVSLPDQESQKFDFGYILLSTKWVQLPTQ
jgi:hypothetical protein